MTVTIDKETITTHKIKMFRQTSASVFAVALPPTNVFAVFGVSIPPGMYFPNHPVWVQDGYWIMLNLSLGKHILHFHGEIPGTVVDVTDTMNVVVAP
jgi:hypothetical protein